jgi:methylglutaconyl-CoA hydratase
VAEILLIEKRDGVATVTLNRPDVRNAFDDVLISSLTAVLKQIEDDKAVRVLVLAGAGTAFCAGADLNWMKRMAGYGYDQNLADARALAAMLKTLDRLSKPTVARVQGPAFAGGTGLVAACDIAVGSTEAVFALTEVKIGLSPATISPYVIRAIGERAARRYFLTGERFDAEEGHRLGLLSLLVPPGGLDAAVEGVSRHLARRTRGDAQDQGPDPGGVARRSGRRRARRRHGATHRRDPRLPGRPRGHRLVPREAQARLGEKRSVRKRLTCSARS